MRSPLPVVLCLALAFAAPAVAKSTHGPADPPPRSKVARPGATRPLASRPAPGRSRPERAHATRAAPAASALAQAEVALRKVQRDPSKRRYRHEWERAIRGLERAATGRDRAPALLAAARARYALYRFSQVEADRAAALKLASSARRAGAPEAAAFAAAVRREAGDDRPAPATPTSHASAPHRTARPVPSSSSRSTPARVASSPREPRAVPSKEAPASPVPVGATTATAAAAPPAGGSAEPETGTDPVLDRIVAQVAGITAEPRAGGVLAAPAPAPAPATSPAPPQKVAPANAPPATAPTAAALEPGSPAGPPAGASAAAPAPAAPSAAEDPALRRILEQLREPPPHGMARSGDASAQEHDDRGPVRRIVIDAGHGGHDTGAIGPSGVREKDVALAMARRLARRLREAGYEVVLTRDDDRFLALDERTAIANRARGDLFVSLHANAHPRRDLAGIETYVLDVGHDRYARRLAARENGALALDETTADEPDVRRILTDLDAKASAEPSRRLAAAVQRELATGIRAHFGDVRDLGVKSALFYVLLGARMPAVLVETSFISNRVEERRLASKRFQEQVASGIARAIDGFASREARVARADGRAGAGAGAGVDASD